MTRRVALIVCLVTLLFTATARAHHPGGVSNIGGGGPIVTIPAATLEQGHAGVAFWYEYARLGGLGDADLANAGVNHIHAHSIGTMESAVAAFAYGVTDDFMVALRAPFNRRTDIREGGHFHPGGGLPAVGIVNSRGDSTGFGDVTLLGQWRFYNNVMSQTQAAFLFGVKAPTGSTNVYDQLGELFETEFQPGTGSWDWLLGAAFSQRLGAWSFDTNVLYVGATTGAQNTNMGDRFFYNAAVSYRLIGSTPDPRNAMAHAGHSHGGAGHLPAKAPPVVAVRPSWSLDAILELNGEWHDRQVTAGVVDENSGGNTIYLSPGLRVSYDRASAFALFGIPVVNNYNGLQSKPDYRIVTGMSFAF